MCFVFVSSRTATLIFFLFFIFLLFLFTGYYQDGEGRLECKACPVDTYLTEEGKSSKADCTSCDFAREHTTTDGKVGRTNSETDCICKGANDLNTISPNGFYTDGKKEGKCLDCPMGADCHRNGMAASDLFAKVGYWRASTNSIEFTHCADAFKKSLDPIAEAIKRCPGGGGGGGGGNGSSGSGGGSSDDDKRGRRLRNMTEESFDPNEQCQQESNAGGTELIVAFGGPMCQTCMNEQFTGNGCKSFVKRLTRFDLCYVL